MVEPVSGPSAIITALSVSGFDTKNFAFYGFLPRENKALDGALAGIVKSGVSPVVLYESPHRVVDLLERIARKLPDARVCVCCDLTKKFERVDRGEVQQILSRLKALENVEKGEYCVVMDLHGVPEEKEEKPAAEISVEARLAEEISRGMTLREAQEILIEKGEKKNAVKQAALRLKKSCGAE